jgi:GDP-4-dehydro-6-deoxy-D-mannose reductase
MVEAYWLANVKCPPGELYLIGSDDSQKIYSYREVIKMLIEKSNVKDIEIKQDPQYVRPTAVPRLIGDTTKFRKLTGWEPKIGIDDILNDTLQYWRDFIKNNDY